MPLGAEVAATSPGSSGAHVGATVTTAGTGCYTVH